MLEILFALMVAVPPSPGLEPCVHYEEDGCLNPTEEPWSEHCPTDKPRVVRAGKHEFTKDEISLIDRGVICKDGKECDIVFRGEVVARCTDYASCPFDFEAEEARSQVSNFRITIEGDGWKATAIANSDGSCPMNNCNGTLRNRTTGPYPTDKEYPARVDLDLRSTGQLDIELVPIHE